MERKRKRTSTKAHPSKARQSTAAEPLSIPTKRRRTAKQERAEDLRRNTRFLTMHKARCAICKHPLFNDITKAYLNGTPFAAIREAYGVSLESLATHTRALQLRTLREAKAARSSRALAKHILSLCRFNADHPPNKETVLLAMKMMHEADMATLPKKVHLTGSIEIKDKLIPLAQEIAKNMMLRAGMTHQEVTTLMTPATVDAVRIQGLVREPTTKNEEDEEET